MTEYIWSESWTAVDRGNEFLLNAGADLSFTTEATNDLRAILDDAQEGYSSRPALEEAQSIFDQLVIVGAIVPCVQAAATIAIRWIGAPNTALLDRIAVDPEAESTLLIRTNASLSDVLTFLELNPLRNYLFVDAGYHHTFSLGPFAVDGGSCAACLVGRLRERWGDEMPPSRPAVLEDTDLLNAILRREIKQINVGRPTLTNATSTWDLATSQSKREVLYRVPGCPVCVDPLLNGHVSLPWVR